MQYLYYNSSSFQNRSVKFFFFLIKHRNFNNKSQIQMLAQCIQEVRKDKYIQARMNFKILVLQINAAISRN